MANSFEAQIALAVRGYCTDGEIATLRRAHIEMGRATNTFDVEGVFDAGRQLQGISPGYPKAYSQISAAN